MSFGTLVFKLISDDVDICGLQSPDIGAPRYLKIMDMQCTGGASGSASYSKYSINLWSDLVI